MVNGKRSVKGLLLVWWNTETKRFSCGAGRISWGSLRGQQKKNGGEEKSQHG